MGKNEIFGGKGISLIEVIIVGGLGAAALAGFLSFQSNMTKRNLENSARAAAQTELEDFALRLRKDFERHAVGTTGTDGIQLAPAPAPFTTPTNGLQPCQNVTVLQTILNTSGANTKNKIQYETECATESFPTGFAHTLIHPELSTSGCTKARRVKRTFYPSSTSTGGAQVSYYPTAQVRTMTMCVRPNAAANPTQYGIEISVAYRTADGSWKVIDKTLNLAANEFGTSGIELISPQ